MSSSDTPKKSTRVQCTATGGFPDWLASSGGSVLMTTYQAGKVAAIGWDGNQVTLLMRQFEKPLGLTVAGDRIALATRSDLWILANAPLLAADYREDMPGRYDALFVPRASYHTGNLHAHDVAFRGDELVFVNTRFSCLARPSRDYSFEPFWRPPFVTDFVPEDRCHLNGLAMRDGRIRYVTALGATDTVGGWRPTKATGGVLIDLEGDRVVCDGLCMPHSPRWYDGRLWVLNSGTGELLVVDPDTGQRDVVSALPGYVRGLSFVGSYALVGLSRVREKHIFGGLPIQQKYDALRCGVAVVDLRSGSEVGMFEYTAGCSEIYDVQFLPGVRRPMILNLEKKAARRAVTYPDSSYWLRPSSEVREGAAENTDAAQNQVPPLSSEANGQRLSAADNLLPDTGF